MKKRHIFLIILLAIIVPIQIVALMNIARPASTNDLDFQYVYNYKLSGVSGAYEYYEEEMKVKGRYQVVFNGNIASVQGIVEWTLIIRDTYEYSEERYTGDEIYPFTYDLTTGMYLTGTDQDVINVTGKNVWFHCPTLSTSELINILDTNYTKSGEKTIWVGNLMPIKGIHLLDTNTFNRDDDYYGQMEAKYTSNYYFTKDGYLLGEKYTEYDTGNYNGIYSEFEIKSDLYVTSANYIRSINWFAYFMAYVFPVLIYIFLAYVVYDIKQTMPKRVINGNKQMMVQWEIPPNLPYQMVSQYTPFFQAYIMRAYGQGDRVLSVTDGQGIVGLGMIDNSDNVGTFFGTYINEMTRYGKVDYFFSENASVPGFSTIEKYDIYKITDLLNMKIEYDAHLIRPVTGPYLPVIMRLVAEEDFGHSHPKYASWVKEAAYTDVALLAVAPLNDPWVQSILGSIAAKQFPPPDVIADEVVMGVGFVTPGDNGGWMYGLYVHPAFRNSGIGRTLVLARLAALKEMGINNAIAEIAEWNSPAKKLYEKLQAEKIGRIMLYGKRVPKIKVRRH
jgi:ribosomal protein S18 acetylase RimI-like enzyme